MILNLAGGSGDVVNFTVVNGTAAPTSLAENTIWAKTEAEIKGWVLVDVLPSAPVNGVLYILTSKSGKVELSPLKDKTIILHMLKAYHCVSGELVSCEASVYQNGAWVDVGYAGLYLYNDGNIHTDITGGWAGGGTNGGHPSISYLEDRMTITGSSNIASTTIAYMASGIDLTEYKTLTFNGNSNYANARLYIGSTDISEPVPVELGDMVIDVTELTGSYTIGFSFDRPTAVAAIDVVTMYELRLD